MKASLPRMAFNNEISNRQQKTNELDEIERRGEVREQVSGLSVVT